MIHIHIHQYTYMYIFTSVWFFYHHICWYLFPGQPANLILCGEKKCCCRHRSWASRDIWRIPARCWRLPWRELTYPIPKALLKMIFLSPRWDMLIPWRLHFFPTFFLVGHVSAWFFSWSLGEIDAQRGSFFFYFCQSFGASVVIGFGSWLPGSTQCLQRGLHFGHIEKKGRAGAAGCWWLDPNCLILYRKDMFFQSYQFCRYIHLGGLNHGMLIAIYLHQDIFPLGLASFKKTLFHSFCIKVMKTDRKQIGLWTGLRSTSEDLDDWC